MSQVSKVCGCGNSFLVYPYRIDTALYCSRSCRAKAVMLKRGKGYKCPRGSLAKLGYKNPMFNKLKANPSYHSLHDYVRKYKPCNGVCEHCGEPKKLDLANKKPYRYLRDLDDWLWLCRRCHTHYDNTIKHLLEKNRREHERRLNRTSSPASV